MKKRIITIISLLILGLGWLNAQNFDKNKVAFSYTKMPLTPLSKEITTYSVRLDLGYIYAGDSKTVVENSIKNAATINHLKKIFGNGAQLFVRLESYYKSEKKIVENVKSVKKGEERVNVTYYSYRFSYKYPLYFEMRLPGEVDPYESVFINNSDQMSSYKSKEYKSKSELYKWWNENYKTLQGELRKKLLSRNTSMLKKHIENKYGYTSVSTSNKFLTVKKFKKFDYSDVTSALEIAKTAFSLVKKEDLIFNDDFKAKIQEAVDQWNKILEESDLENKKTRINEKITEALYTNIYMSYVYMDEFDKADKIKELTEISDELERLKTDRQARYNANIDRL